MELQIIVKGSVNTGKSTIARYITEKLKELNFDAENVEFDEILSPVDSKTQRKRMGCLLDKGVEIRVDAEQTPRQSPITRITDREGNVFQYIDGKPVKIK